MTDVIADGSQPFSAAVAEPNRELRVEKIEVDDQESIFSALGGLDQFTDRRAAGLDVARRPRPISGHERDDRLGRLATADLDVKCAIAFICSSRRD